MITAGWRPTTVAVLVLAATTSIAGCGGSAAKTATSAPTGGTSGNPVLVGELTPTSGQGFNYPEWLAGAQAAARAINAAGGIKGRQVKIDECDDQNNPNQATACARKMVSDKVIAVAGGASLFGNTMVPILQKGAVAWMGDFPQTEPEYNSTNMFLLDKGGVESGAGSVLALHAVGAKSIFSAHLQVPQGDAQFAEVKQGAAAAGVRVLGDASFPLTATDMSSFVQQAKDSKAEGVTFAGLAQQQVAYTKTAKQLGAGFTLGVTDGSLTPAQYNDTGNFSTVITGGLPPVTAGADYPDKYPGVTQFMTDLKAEFDSGNKYADPAQATLHQLVAWLSVKVIAQVAATATAVDAPAVLAALNSAKDIKTGVIPPWTPSATGPAKFSRVSNKYSWFSKIGANGKPTLLASDPVDFFKLAGFPAG